MDNDNRPRLRIAILTSKRQSYSVRRLLEVGRERGHTMRAMDPQGFAILLDPKSPTLLYRGKPIPPLDAVIPRISAITPAFGAAVVQQFQQMGIFCANTSQAILKARDKFRASQVMTNRGINIPRTAFVAEPSTAEGAMDHVGGAPVVVKLIEGSQGAGVTLAEHTKTAMALVDILHSAGQQVLLQSFVEESRGKDVRVLVVDGEAIGAMRRTASGDDFRSNLHRGGTAEAVELSEDYRRSAIRAAQVLGLGIAGVDILEADDGPMVIEVNSSPGLEGIEGATGLDIAGSMIDFVESACDLPEVDIKQRLTMAKRHTIVELHLGPGSKLIGKRLAECEFFGPKTQTLTVNRGEEVLALPEPDTVLEEGDNLVVFGPQQELRKLVPRKGKKRRKQGAPKESPSEGGNGL